MTELLIRFPMKYISYLYHFRFELVEPAIDDTLQRAGNGFCDYGFCDEQFLSMIAYVEDPAAALPLIRQSLERAGTAPESIWISVGGVPQDKLWEVSSDSDGDSST